MIARVRWRARGTVAACCTRGGKAAEPTTMQTTSSAQACAFGPSALARWHGEGDTSARLKGNQKMVVLSPRITRPRPLLPPRAVGAGFGNRALRVDALGLGSDDVDAVLLLRALREG